VGELYEEEFMRNSAAGQLVFSTIHLDVLEVLKLGESAADDERVSQSAPFTDVVVWQWEDESAYPCGQLPIDEVGGDTTIEGVAFLDINSPEAAMLPLESVGGSYGRLAYLDSQELVADGQPAVSGKMNLWFTLRDGVFETKCAGQPALTLGEIRGVIAEAGAR